MNNNFALNLVTKGLLNISNITKGMILTNFEIVFKRKRGGGSGQRVVPLHYDRESLFREIEKHEEDDISLIKVNIDWYKSITKDKTISAKLLKTQIEYEILQETKKRIRVEII